MQRVEQLVAAAPLNTGVVAAAFARLQATGQLPESQRLAAAVIDLARAEPTRDEPIDLATGIGRLGELVSRLEAGELPVGRTDSIRDMIFDEALEQDEVVRGLARLALVCLAAAGRDATQPLCLDEQIDMSAHGTIGMHVVRVADQVPPQYRAQARRLLKQAAEAVSVPAPARQQREPRARLHDAASGPPVPDTPRLLDGVKRLVEIATELGLVGAPPG